MEEEEKYILMAMDMQNDFCSNEGVYARRGFDPGPIATIVPRIARVMNLCRERHIPIVASQLTILTDLDGNAMGLGHLRTLRPFLTEEGFRPGTWGHEIIDDLPTPDYKVRKWGYSAMYQTEMEKVLRSLGGTTLVFTGIATNGVVEGTARDAVAREFEVITLSDCVMGYSMALHEASLKNLANIGKMATSQEITEMLGHAPGVRASSR